MSRRLFEDIAIGARVPLNRTAANVLRSGEKFNPNLSEHVLKAHGDTPIRPELRAFPLTKIEQQVFRELIGKRYGGLTVIGLSLQRPKRWVVRCDCGMYTFRTAKTIRVGFEDDCCLICRSTHGQVENDCDREELPPLVLEPRSNGKDEVATFRELLGRRINGAQVLGMSQELPGKWVIQCDCGRYRLAPAKFIRKSKRVRCRKCDQLAYNQSQP